MKSNIVMDKARVTYARAEAERVWQDHGGGKIPVCLNDIVKSLGIQVVSMSLEESTSGYTREGVIIYNNNHPTTRQRFTIAHEMGHIIIDHVPLIGETSQQSERLREEEANAFANALLLPEKDLKAFMKSKDKRIENIAERYFVSEEAVKFTVSKNSRLFNLLKV